MTTPTPTREASLIKRLYNRSRRPRRGQGPDVPPPLREARAELLRRHRATLADLEARQQARREAP